MQVIFHIRDVLVTDEQKDLMAKKLERLKRYLKEEPLIIDVYLQDESSPEKGGLDQAVELSAVFDGQKIFVREIDDQIMEAFAFAFKRLKSQVEQFHEEKEDKLKGKTNNPEP